LIIFSYVHAADAKRLRGVGDAPTIIGCTAAEPGGLAFPDGRPQMYSHGRRFSPGTDMLNEYYRDGDWRWLRSSRPTGRPRQESPDGQRGAEFKRTGAPCSTRPGSPGSGASRSRAGTGHSRKLADIMLDLTITLSWRKLRKRHRDQPRFAVISYGKLGGKELG